ncbi:unnamed protein product [Urochloa decumbens]|uniref:peroxidase n=1 Tax=Urochloa decumbens TaxID=240449 RepID=A0ABC9FY42_9POAL
MLQYQYTLTRSQSRNRRMVAATLTVLTGLALLGSVSCQGGYGDRHQAPPPQPRAYPPPSTRPQPPAYPPITLQPPSYSPVIPNSPPPRIYPPTSPSSPSPKTPQPPIYTPASPSTSPPPKPPQPPANPPTSPSPRVTPPPHVSPSPPTYPPTSPSPPPPMPSPPPPPLSPSPPPPVPPPSPDDAGKKLEVGHYNDKCGYHVDVEAIVRKHVSSFDNGMKAGLIRLFFHDCFIRGCDASILLDPTSDNQQPEKFGIPNFPSMRGYEVIDAAKAELEAKCPNTVSCADIVAFAARDASFFLSGGGIDIAMPAGRYDGNVSLASETLPNLPPPFAGLQQLEKMFADKGLDAFDMVTLSGAHSVGRSHCSSFTRDRLPPSATSSDMDPAFAAELQANCTSPASGGGGGDNTVVEDYETPDVLDNQYYQNVLDRKVLFTSDAALTTKDMTNNLVRVYAIFPWLWQQKFEEAMVKMSRIEIKTAATGEIRKMCRVVNSKP